MKEYLKLFEGQPASLNQIVRETDLLSHTVNVLIQKNKVVGQRTLGLDEPSDIIIYPGNKMGSAPILIKEGVYRK